MSKSCDLSFQ